MYGGFWMSFATIFLPGSGVLAAYESADELNSALGIYLWTWFIITFLLLYVSITSPSCVRRSADHARAIELLPLAETLVSSCSSSS